MAKAKAKTGLTKFNKFLFIVFIILLIATILIVALSSASAVETETQGEVVDDVVLDSEFVAGTYGGVEFKTLDDVATYYAEAYDYTKSLTADYKLDDGSTVSYYKMLGQDNLDVSNLLVDGKENGTINSLVPTIVGGLFTNSVNGLPPCTSRDPSADNDINGDSLGTSRFVPDDLLAASVTDNNDGTITIVMQPKMYQLSTPGLDSQGHMFTTLGDITGVVSNITVLSFEQGDANSNIVCNYMGGTATVTINTSTKEIVEADYHEVVKIAITHATVTIIKDKSASLTVTYDMHYPATDDYIAKNASMSRVD